MCELAIENFVLLSHFKIIFNAMLTEATTGPEPVDRCVRTNNALVISKFSEAFNSHTQSLAIDPSL